MESHSLRVVPGGLEGQGYRAMRISRRAGESPLVFVLVAFEGPDPYARAGGLATRVVELSLSLGRVGFDTHLFFIGDPDLPGEERIRGSRLVLHRWCQWISQYHPEGAYDGEEGKYNDLTRSLPPYVHQHIIQPVVQAGRLVVVMAEEWQTAQAVCDLADLVRGSGLAERVLFLWNANHTYSFHRIDWGSLAERAMITTVSKYMKHTMQGLGVDPLVIPNGIPQRWLQPVDERDKMQLRAAAGSKTLLTKVARWSRDKRWLMAVEAVGLLKRRGLPVLLLTRGGPGDHEGEVLARARGLGLQVHKVNQPIVTVSDLAQALRNGWESEVICLDSFLGDSVRRALFASADGVLANSGMEPFGLVGLETMAVGGVPYTGCTGEDYVIPFHNAVMLETDDPREIARNVIALEEQPSRKEAIRTAGRRTARGWTWPKVIEHGLLSQLGRGTEARGLKLGSAIESVLSGLPRSA
ncbi:MAG: glycosyltransferase family 4 protein [Chloroflexi bacterium]|nr:glycosyltransferase family 4 protein [Chloroflexota bacterium]